MKKEVVNVRCTHPHFCYDWDSMFITPLMDEFESCTCECAGGKHTEKELRNFAFLDGFEEKNLEEYINHLKEKGELP